MLPIIIHIDGGSYIHNMGAMDKSMNEIKKKRRYFIWLVSIPNERDAKNTFFYFGIGMNTFTLNLKLIF